MHELSRSYNMECGGSSDSNKNMQDSRAVRPQLICDWLSIVAYLAKLKICFQTLADFDVRILDFDIRPAFGS